jgi:ribonuclease-3
LLEAVTHSSFANENPQISPRDNERLEYLGDAVLQLITAEYLYKHHPGATEGELTQTRSAMVNTNTLAQLAEQLDLGSYLYLGKGIAKGGGRNLKSLLANAFEAVLGAMFLDAGYDAAYHYYLDRYRSLPAPARDENFKGRLQQVAQERFGETPFYDSEGARVGNRREYTSVVFAGAEPLGTGHGASKQEAEQDAARVALESLLGSSAAEAPAAKAAKPRARRAPRKKREVTPPAPAATAEVITFPALPEAELAPLAPEPRSRQFGEPIE